MAAIKHTFIFKLTDPGITEDDLYRLVLVLRGSTAISWKYDMDGSRVYNAVQMFTDTNTVFQLITRAAWRNDLIAKVKQSRLHGDAATGQASERLDRLRLKASIPVPLVIALNRLLKAGCQITLEKFNNGDFEAKVFGESFTFGNSDSAAGFLRGLEKGFTSAPMWESAQEHIVPRDQFDSVLELIHDELSLPENRDTKDIWMHAVQRARQVVRQSRKAPTYVGSPQMGSTPATRRSKRSA